MSMQDKWHDLRDSTSRFGTTSPLVTHDIDEALIAPTPCLKPTDISAIYFKVYGESDMMKAKAVRRGREIHHG